MAVAAGEASASGQEPVTVVLAEHFEIDPGAPLPALDRPSARAFAAIDRRDRRRPLFALLCTAGLPPRAAAIAAMRDVAVPGLLTLRACAAISWPALHGRCLALIYDRPMGGPLAAPLVQLDARGGETPLVRELLAPIVAALLTLAERGLAHRAIRADNLWFLAEGGTSPVLGDWLAGPAGFDQPVAYEPLERASAQPAGRGGEGDAAADVFSLGVALLAMLGGDALTTSRDDADVLAGRLQSGSWTALTRGMRVPLPLIEPLRGMLADEPGERWPLREVHAWVEDRSVPPVIRRLKTPRASFPFVGRDHADRRSLAAALAGNPGEAAKSLRSGAVIGWLRNAAGEAACAKRMSDLVASARGREAADDVIVARAALVLDPAGPIRYRGCAYAADGFGPLLAEHFLRDGQSQALAETLALQLPQFRLGEQPAAAAEVEAGRGLRSWERWTGHLRAAEPGYGVERILYESNPGLPCLSLLLTGRHVVDVDGLMTALEDVAGSAGEQTRPFDRHIAAFVAARSTLDDATLAAGRSVAGSVDISPAAAAAITAVAVLAWVQQARSQQAPPVKLARWLGRSLAPVLAAYHGRAARLAFESDLQRAVARGDLGQMQKLVCDAERLRRDRDAFRAAAASYAHSGAEIARLANGDVLVRRAALAAGNRAAALVGCTAAIASAAISITLFGF